MGRERWKFFLGACFLASAMLHAAGAPVGPVVAGFVVGAVITWLRG
jgi:hypothetical protein